MKDKPSTGQKIIDLMRLHRQTQLILIGGALTVGLVIGYIAGNWHVFLLQTQVQQLQQQQQELYERAEALDYQQHIANVELGIEKAATESIQQELLTVQDENFALRREIVFYQKIMAPELEAGGVSIDSLEIQLNRSADHYHFRLAIVQLERQRALTKGTVRIRLYGRQGEQGQHYDLLSLANIDSSEREFSMRYFTVMAGDFVMPADFLPERIDVAIEVDGRNQESLARSFYWTQLVDNT